MPNANAPTGLTPRRYRNGSPWMGAARQYFVAASDATALYVGDPVVITASTDTTGHAQVTRATAGASNRITGVVVGFRPSAPMQSAYPARPASQAGYVLVADDPDLLFEIQENAATDGAALTAAAMGKNVNLIAGTGGANGSGFMIDSTSAATTNTGQLRVVELQRRTDNVIGAYAKWLVAINQPTETGAAGSTGV